MPIAASIPLPIRLRANSNFLLTQRWQQSSIDSKPSSLKLACHEGEQADRDATAEVMADLRVPLYSKDLVYVRQCERSEELVDRWKTERGGNGDWRHAFLRALYEVKPLILALPTTWIWKDMEALSPRNV